MNGELRIVGGPPITMDDGRVVGFGESFDIDELADDELLKRLLDSGQIVFVLPEVEPDPEDLDQLDLIESEQESEEN